VERIGSIGAAPAPISPLSAAPACAQMPALRPNPPPPPHTHTHYALLVLHCQVANEAWVEQIKASYVPLKISDSLYIVPEWSEPEDLSATNVILQPGVAFGTGGRRAARLLAPCLTAGGWGRLTCAACYLAAPPARATGRSPAPLPAASSRTARCEHRAAGASW
jgi:hypothetical protein